MIIPDERPSFYQVEREPDEIENAQRRPFQRHRLFAQYPRNEHRQKDQKRGRVRASQRQPARPSEADDNPQRSRDEKENPYRTEFDDEDESNDAGNRQYRCSDSYLLIGSDMKGGRRDE